MRRRRINGCPGGCRGESFLLPLLLATLVLGACRCSAPPAAVAPRWLKGQLHAHTNGSPDCRTTAERVLERYSELGFDFVVLTDHNVATIRPGEDDRRALKVLPGIELTQNLRTCTPDWAEPCPIHMNALLVGPGAGFVPSADGVSRVSAYAHAAAWGRAHGAILQLNHPNYGFAADTDVIAALVADHGVALLEIANRGPDVGNEGGDGPSTEVMWDQVLSRGLKVWGTATDDAHQYDDAAEVRARGGLPSLPGLGWVRVWAVNEADAIRQALVEGRFYASTGVELSKAGPDDTRTSLVVEVDSRSQGEHRFTVIGKGGKVLQRSVGRSVRFSMIGQSGGYVRALVEDARGMKAWVQPVLLP